MSIDVLDRLRAADTAASMPEPDADDRERLRRAIVATPLDPRAASRWRLPRGRALVVLVAGLILLGGAAVYAGVKTAGVLIGPQPNQVVWKFKTGGPVRSSLAVAKGVVYVGSDDGYLYALDSRSAQPRWTFRTGGKVRSLPVVAGGVVYCRSSDGYLYALDSQSGRQRWRFNAGGPAASSPAVEGGAVYVASDDGYLYALDSRSGQQRWRLKTGADVNADSAYPASPAVSRGVVYFGTGSLDAFDSKTGQKKWTFNPGAVSQATPVVSHGLVYLRVTGFMNGIWAVDAQSGRGKWFFVAGGRPPASSSPAILGGVVYCNGRGLSGGSRSNRDVFWLHALDARSGKEIWASDGSNEGSVAVSGGVVCLTDEKTLYAVDAKTGHEKWQYETGGPISSAPAISNGVAFVGSDDGYLYAVK